MPISYYCRPDELWSLGGAVADTVGTTDSDYTNEWLADARYGRPARASSTTMTWTITNTSGTVNFVSMMHHNVSAGRSITIGGTIAASLTVPSPARPNGIPRNPFASIAVNSAVTTMSVAIVGNTSPVIGKVFAGLLRSFPRQGFLVDAGLSDDLKMRPVTPGFLQTYDDGYSAPRTWVGTVRCSDAQADDMLALFEAQKGGSLPAILIPNIGLQDTRAVYFEAPRLKREGLLWRAELSAVEYPQARW